MTASIRPLTRPEIESDSFFALLQDAAGVELEALLRIRDVELERMQVIGVVDDVVTGFAAFDVEPDRIVLHYIVVAQRGTGLGTRLVEALRSVRTDLPLYAETDDDAIGFYRALGFAVTEAPRDPRWPTRQRYACTIVRPGTGAEHVIEVH